MDKEKTESTQMVPSFPGSPTRQKFKEDGRWVHGGSSDGEEPDNEFTLDSDPPNEASMTIEPKPVEYNESSFYYIPRSAINIRVAPQYKDDRILPSNLPPNSNKRRNERVAESPWRVMMGNLWGLFSRRQPSEGKSN